MCDIGVDDETKLAVAVSSILPRDPALSEKIQDLMKKIS